MIILYLDGIFLDLLAESPRSRIVQSRLPMFLIPVVNFILFHNMRTATRASCTFKIDEEGFSEQTRKLAIEYTYYY